MSLACQHIRLPLGRTKYSEEGQTERKPSLVSYLHLTVSNCKSIFLLFPQSLISFILYKMDTFKVCYFSLLQRMCVFLVVVFLDFFFNLNRSAELSRQICSDCGSIIAGAADFSLLLCQWLERKKNIWKG